MEDHKSDVLAACRLLLRPVVRMLLRAGVTWKEFADLCKTAFVEIATQDYGLKGRPTNVSRVAILTGLNRREVKRQRDIIAADEPQANVKLNHATRVLSGWYQDEDFLGKDGQPLSLPLEGEGATFAGLLERYAGDIPAGAMLKELKLVGAVEETSYGRLRALTRYYMPLPMDPETVLRAGGVLRDLGTTINYNLSREAQTPSRFEGRASNALIDPAAAAEFRDFLESKGQAFLEEIDDWLSAHEIDGDPSADVPGVRLGAGVYMIEDDTGGGKKS